MAQKTLSTVEGGEVYVLLHRKCAVPLAVAENLQRLRHAVEQDCRGVSPTGGGGLADHGVETLRGTSAVLYTFGCFPIVRWSSILVSVGGGGFPRPRWSIAASGSLRQS